jgi:hypothetical protein
MNLENIYYRFQEFYDKFDHGQGAYSEERVKQRAEYHAFVRNTYFMSIDERNNFNSAYAGKKLPMFIRYAPPGQPDGYYKIGILGKLRNPVANWEGYLPTRRYFIRQLQLTLKFAVGWVGGTSFDFSVIGFIVAVLMTIVLFLAAIIIRLPLAILFTVIQMVYVLFAQKK